MAQTFKFIVKLKDQEATQYVLDAGKIGIGRHPDNEIQILVAEVSGKHAELNRSDDGGYTITDVGSSNGTRVNGAKITANEAVRLTTGDTLLLGEEVGVDFVAEGATGASPAPPRKKLALPPRKLAAKVASTSTPPSMPGVSPATPTVQIANPGVAQGTTTGTLNQGARTAKLSNEPTLKKPEAAPSTQPKPVRDPNAPDSEDGSVAIAVPRKLQPPEPKAVAVAEPAPVAEPEPAAEPTPVEKPRPALKLAKKKLAAPAPKPSEGPPPLLDDGPEPEAEKKPRPALKLAKKKLAAPKPAAVEAEPEPEPGIETASEPEASAAASLDQNSKGVTVIKKQEPSANPEATPVLRKKDIVEDESPPELTKKDQPKDVLLKKADPVKDDGPPKLVVPKKTD